MKKIRIALALLFLSGITLMFVGIEGLSSWMGWMPKMQFLPAVMALNAGVIIFIVLLTFCFGRIYCSVICPLGVMQDGISRVGVLVKRLRKNRRPFHYRKEQKLIRYGIWVLFVAAILAGVQVFVALLAPYSAYGRIVNSIFSFKTGPVLVVAAVTLVAVGITALFFGRQYCNIVCPVGTTLSFFSRFAIFRPVIDADKCKNCKMCEHACKASCIDIKTHSIDYSRCVDCFDCIDNCKFGALQYRNAYHKTTAPVSMEAGSANGRRAFLAGAALGLGALSVKAQNKKVDGGFAEVLPKRTLERETPLTPPGSVSVNDFYRRCTACQLCVSACPNGVLRPSADLNHLMQPQMGFENGYCRPECTECSTVCPSGAILSITREEKTQYHVGTASVNRELCVAEHGTSCGNCARHCPVGAIQMIESSEGFTVPSVDASVCIGCGACEFLCPARPVSAITVNGRHQHLDI